MFTNNLTLNVLNFSQVQKRLTISISTHETFDSFRLSTQDCKTLSTVFGDTEELYCIFDATGVKFKTNYKCNYAGTL